MLLLLYGFHTDASLMAACLFCWTDLGLAFTHMYVSYLRFIQATFAFLVFTCLPFNYHSVWTSLSHLQAMRTASHYTLSSVVCHSPHSFAPSLIQSAFIKNVSYPSVNFHAYCVYTAGGILHEALLGPAVPSIGVPPLLGIVNRCQNHSFMLCLLALYSCSSISLT